MKKITLLAGLALLQFNFAGAQAVTFNYTGSVQTYTVPACVTSITVDIQGAQGGTGPRGCSSNAFQLGGLGGRTQATLNVTPGDVLYIYVGGAGTNDNNTSAAGGFNGGGNAMFEAMYTYYGGGGGGGASDIRLNGNALTDRIVVAGGGGGAGSDGCNCEGLAGGQGGGLTAGAGNPGSICVCNPSGLGGDQFAGGARGDWGCTCNATAGSLGQGGDSNSSSCGGPTGGGAGGGGYYGGGGGGLGAGGGGSNYTDPSATGVINTMGFRSGDGLVIVTPNNGVQNPGPISGTATVCANTTGNYSITSLIGATNYTWTVPVGTTINSGQGTNSINITAGSTSGTISVVVSFTCGTSTPSTLTLTINPALTVGFTASPSSTVCPGTNVTLSGTGASTYAWSGGVIDGVPFTATSTNTYTVTGTSAGCTNTATATITVNTAPTIGSTSSPSSSICPGSSVTLSGTGGVSYSWSGGITDGVPFTPSATTTYTVTGTDANGCTNTATATITVLPLPTIGSTATPSSTVCAGSNVTLNGTGAVSYAWSGGVTDGVPFVLNTTTTYTVTGTDANGCMNTATTTITASPLPNVGSTAFPSTSICNGNAVTLNGTGASSYSWSSSVTNGVPFIPTSTATYTVTGTNASGCSNTTTITVFVNPAPFVTANSSSSNVMCGGDTVVLTGGGASTYSWSGGVTNGVPFILNSTTTFTVTGTNSSGCSNTATITITVNGLPTVTANASDVTVCLTDAPVTLTGTPAGGTWSGPAITGNMFNPMAATTGVHALFYTYTDANGCTNMAYVNVDVGVCDGITESSLANGVSVFPNPNNGSFTIAVNANVGDMTIELMDLQGRVIYTSNENNVQAGFSKQVAIENVSNGMYVLRLTTNGDQRIEKISVQK